MKFPEFNSIVNPTNDKCYNVKTSTNLITNITFAEARELASDPTSAIYWIIPKGFLVIRTTSKIVVDTIIARKEPVFVVETPTCFEIYCKSNFYRCTANNMLSCGAECDTIGYTSSDTTILLPFRSPKNICSLYTGISMIYGSTIDTCPIWMRPILKRSAASKKGISLPITQDVPQALVTLISHLKEFTESDKENIISTVNTFMCNPSLTIDELKALFKRTQVLLTEQFFEDKTFLHYKFGDYIIENCHIKRDSVTNQLFFYDYKRNIYVQDQDYLMGYMTKICPRLKQNQKNEVMDYINHSLYDERVPFNKSETNIVFKNGILDIADMSFEPMSPDKLESVQINANFNPSAHSDTADEFFRTATGGDKDCKQVLLEAIGYSMLKTSEMQKTFMLVGSGRNGKSTYLDLLKHILGEGNFGSISMKDLSNNFRVSMLEGKLASIAADISAKPIEDTDLFKNIASGDEITVEKKYENARTGKLFATMFFACNKLPRTTDTSDGFYRRWTIVPFNANLNSVSTVEGANFKKKLLAQESIDYVAYQAVMAISVVMNKTLAFTEPECVKKMIEEYKIENSSVLSWIKETYPNGIDNKGTDILIPLKKLGLYSAYDNYKQWCSEAGRKSSSKATFKNEIKTSLGVELK